MHVDWPMCRGRSCSAALGLFVAVFTSWDFIAKYDKGFDKLARGANRDWFGVGTRVTPAHMVDVVRRDVDDVGLVAVFVGRSATVRNCTTMFCVSSIARANCMHAIDVYERATGHWHGFILVGRSVPPLRFPLRLVNCDVSRETGRLVEVDKCEVRAGACVSYFKGHFFPSIARLRQNNSMVAHCSISRPPKRAMFVDTFPWWHWLSDQVQFGPRAVVAAMLYASIDVSDAARSRTGRMNIAEAMMAEAAYKANIQFDAVNFGVSGGPSLSAASGRDQSIDPKNRTAAYNFALCNNPFLPKVLADVCSLNVTRQRESIAQISNAAPWKEASHTCCATLRACMAIPRAHMPS